MRVRKRKMSGIFDAIEQKYQTIEDDLNKQLTQIEMDLKNMKLYETSNDANGNYIIKGIPTLNEAKIRNREIIKSLSLANARLRSRAIYNPAEITWCSIMQKYKNHPSLSATSWECCT